MIEKLITNSWRYSVVKIWDEYNNSNFHCISESADHVLSGCDA